jgi:glycosidase
MRTEKWHGFGAFHGYWLFEPGQLEPRFGTEATLRALSKELHQKKMKLIIDLVVNHVGPDAPAVTQHPDWFHHLGGVQHWDDAFELLNHDVHGLADLAQEKPEVARWLLDGSRRWLRAGQA